MGKFLGVAPFRLAGESTRGKAVGSLADFYRVAQSMGRSQIFRMGGGLF